MKDPNPIGPKGLDLPPLMDAATTYWIDTMQRWALFADTLRQRGNTWQEQASSAVPHVLSFDADLILDGRTLPRPVNYLLVRIKAPKGVVTDRTKRPFIVFDPRAGHGPGIGGMKQDSEIGVALKAGHPCYFVGFLPEPVAGQTIEDVCIAEATFIEKVIDLEPEAESRPCLIGNCQAGWQIMLDGGTATRSGRPDHPGRFTFVLLAGVRGKSPMRYLGGLLGGTWMTSLAGDLGDGIFDGADLIANFESMNPANTYWQKPYNVFSQIDSEPARFLDFETWWGSPVLLNAGEMQWIADNLFVGNKLTRGEIASSRASASTCVISRRPSSCSARGETRSRHRRKRWAGFSISMTRRRPGQRRPDHRLYSAPDDRPSRHLRFRQGGDEGTQRVRLVHRPDRYPATGPLRGRHHRGRGRYGPPGAHRRSLPAESRAAQARGYSGIRP